MPTTDLFKDFSPKEISQFGRFAVQAAKDKFPRNFDAPDGQMIEGYQYLSGEISDTTQLEFGTYCNELYNAWKGWAPKYCSRPPSWIVRPANRAVGQPLADACQELFRYRQKKFDYQDLILRCSQDAVICGIAYARHSWDKQIGMTRTKRFKPQHVYPDAGATTWSQQTQIIEKHTMTRWQFAQKYGEDIAYQINSTDSKSNASAEARYWPSEDKYERKGNGPLDPIEYYLLWSVHGGHKRVYAFHMEFDDEFLQPECRKAGKCVGEEWPLDYEDGEWHLTPLIPTVLNDRIIGISAWNVVRGTYLMYQNLLGASVKADLQSVKKPILAPDNWMEEVKQISKNGETVFFVKYDHTALEQGQKIQDLITVLDFGEVNPALQKNVDSSQARFDKLMGVNAVSEIAPGGVETAAEATKLADAANNRVADDQGAVERFVTKIGRKELQGDLLRMPQRSVLKVSLNRTEDDLEAEGETPDENPDYLPNIPYQDAIILEKGPASDSAGLRMEAARDKARNKAMMSSAFGQGGPSPDEAESQIAVTPEVELRRQYGIPVLADVEIVNPGAEQFIGEKATGWPQRAMSLREIENQIGVRVEPGTSSATGKMQAIQEIGMAFKSLYEVYAGLGLGLQQAGIINAFVAKMESELLDDCRVTQQDIEAATAKIQQAQQQAEQAAAQAKQPQGDNPEVVKMQSDAEQAKAAAAITTSKEKTLQIDKKNEGDAARDRSKNFGMLVQNQAMQANGAM